MNQHRSRSTAQQCRRFCLCRRKASDYFCVLLSCPGVEPETVCTTSSFEDRCQLWARMAVCRCFVRRRGSFLRHADTAVDLSEEAAQVIGIAGPG